MYPRVIVAVWFFWGCLFCGYSEPSESVRVVAGLAAKLQGHSFERELATALTRQAGVAFVATSTAKKADVVCEARDLRISLKNPSKGHTQIALIGQERLADTLDLDKDGRQFVRLFFGMADGDALEADEIQSAGVVFGGLSETAEIRRNRLLYSSIPKRYARAFERALNEDKKRRFLFSLVAGDSNVFGWAHEKNNVGSVRFYRTQDILNRLVKARWKVARSQSTFHLVDGDKKYMHMQMKGSSKRYSAGYHSAMIHVYDTVLDGLESLGLGVKSGQLSTKVPRGADSAKVEEMEIGFADVIDRTVFPRLAIKEDSAETAMSKLWRMRNRGEFHPENKVCGVSMILRDVKSEAVLIDQQNMSLRTATDLICRQSSDLFYWLEYDPFKSSLLIGSHKDYLELIDPRPGDESNDHWAPSAAFDEPDGEPFADPEEATGGRSVLEPVNRAD